MMMPTTRRALTDGEAFEHLLHRDRPDLPEHIRREQPVTQIAVGHDPDQTVGAQELVDLHAGLQEQAECQTGHPRIHQVVRWSGQLWWGGCDPTGQLRPNRLSP